MGLLPGLSRGVAVRPRDDRVTSPSSMEVTNDLRQKNSGFLFFLLAFPQELGGLEMLLQQLQQLL